MRRLLGFDTADWSILVLGLALVALLTLLIRSAFGHYGLQ
jgi:hypothetical protein